MRFTRSHEWVNLHDDGTATVGITRYAAEQLGDVVFVEAPEVGKTVGKGDSFAVVESVKAASDVYSPLSGEVIEANTELGSQPEMVNADAEGTAWFAKLRLSAADAEVDELMTPEAYQQYVASL
jgi:glycine cleavage system H protein